MLLSIKSGTISELVFPNSTRNSEDTNSLVWEWCVFFVYSMKEFQK